MIKSKVQPTKFVGLMSSKTEIPNKTKEITNIPNKTEEINKIPNNKTKERIETTK